jgi:hypothetical protein
MLIGSLAQGGSAAYLIAASAFEYTLFDPSGEVLAAASDLPAVLDAFDAGVAEPLPPPHAMVSARSQAPYWIPARAA